MKNNNRWILPEIVKLGIFSLIGLSPLCNIYSAPLPEAYGVWDRGETLDPHTYPFIRGTGCDINWEDTEKSPGVYDWSALDNTIKAATAHNESFCLSFECGPKTPEWVYKAGVPKVLTDDTKHQDKFPGYPYYLSPIYIKYFHRYITEVAKRIRGYPAEVQKRIAFIQVKTGCTGDEVAYKGSPLDPQYKIPSNEWEKFRLETFSLYGKLYDRTEPRISLLFNGIAGEDASGGDGKHQAAWNWVTANITGDIGSKTGALSRGHHLSGEMDSISAWQRYLVDPKGKPSIFAISEMDQTYNKPWYQLNVRLGFYWGAINALNLGQSIWDVTKGAIEVSKEQGFDFSFYFFNKYAGQIHPTTATDAFCALHKGLDAENTQEFPVEKFGKTSKSNTDRVNKICALYAKYGARVDDMAALSYGQVKQRDEQKGYNDVGRGIWADNYSRFLTQIDADATSIPLWRIGGPITKASSIYSRFARGFEHASGKDAMYFKLADGFSADNSTKVMSINVVWYDAQAGSTWELVYDAGEKTMKTGLTVTGKGDKQWHHASVTLNDAVILRGGVKGSDLGLVNTDAKDDIFSLIEVHRGQPVEPALLPPTEFTISNNPPKPPKGTKSKGGK